jgi:DNA-binding transcriptional LysR family regulator
MLNRMADPDWSHYRTLLAVIRTGSLSRAARDLGLAQPSVGRQIAALERSLGAALFTRGPRGLAPTETALALLPHAEAMAASADSLRRAASGEPEGRRGVVRITASEVISAEVLPEILTALRMAEPGLDFELEASNLNADLLRRDADLAVRMQRPTQTALIARRIGEIPIGLHAHRRLLERLDPLDTLEAVLAAPLIGFDRVDWRLPPELGLTRDLFSLRTDNDLVALAALRAGFGVGGCQTPLAARDPDLVRLLPEIVFPLEMWVVMHEDLKGVRRVRRTFDHLVEALGAYVRSAPA